MSTPVGTVFGPDLSNHNSAVDFASLDALSDVHLITHKITEGVGWTDPTVASRAPSLLRFAAPGFYHVLWPTNSQDNPVNQAHWFVDEVIRIAPWMLRHACPVLQGDFEVFSNFTPNRAPTIAECNQFQDEVAAYWKSKGGNPPAQLDYAPHWLYGDAVTGLKHLWWASAYVSGSGSYRALYPGNGDSRWTQVAGHPADVLQYTDNATFGAGGSGFDGNAIRGVKTAAELQAFLLGGDPQMPLDPTDLSNIKAQCVAAVRQVFTLQNGFPVAINGTLSNDTYLSRLWTLLNSVQSDTNDLQATVRGIAQAVSDDATHADIVTATQAVSNMITASQDAIVQAVNAAAAAGGDPNAVAAAVVNALIAQVELRFASIAPPTPPTP